MRTGRVLAVAGVVALTAAGVAQASFTQEPGSPVDVGLHPILVQAADFNADGRPDLLSVEQESISILLRRATGGYVLESGSPISLGPNTGPSGAAIADFNGDGRLDIAVSNFVAANVVILVRQATGGFAQSLGPPIDLGFQPGAVAAGNFAGDSRPDLAVTRWGSPYGVLIYRREGASFALEPAIPPTGVNPRAIAVADFDGVGGTDLAITNRGSSSVTVLLRQGAAFNPENASGYTVGSQPQQIVARDFNGDGRPDLAVPNYGSHTLSLLLRQPGGGFANAPGSPVRVGDGPVGVASGDFNSDGRPDLVTGNQLADTASVLLRTATGFVPDPSSPVATDDLASGVAVADANADGRPDLAVANYSDNSISILLNTTPRPAPPPPPDLDLDNDGVQRPLDCNDADPNIKPGATDKPGDGIDQNCDDQDAPYPLLRRSIEAFSATYPRGRYTKFTTMTVKPVRRGDQLRLTCRGRGCEMRKKTIKVRKNARKLSLLRHMKGAKLRKGAVVQLRITRPETIGRIAKWRIRAPKIPKATRACLPPGAKKPSRCPR